MDRKLFTQPLLGYRAWAIQGKHLAPLTRRSIFAWERGLNTARCYSDRHIGVLSDAHKSPHPDCECGLYAYHSLPVALDTWELYGRSSEGLFPPLSDEGYLLGAVIGRGDVQVHWSGWRAECAQIIALLDDPSFCDQRTTEIAEHYQARLFNTPEQLIAYASSIGQTITANNRPQLQCSEELLAQIRREYDPDYGLEEKKQLAVKWKIETGDLAEIAYQLSR